MGQYDGEPRDPREQLFEELAAELGGKYVDREGWGRDLVEVSVGGWDVTLDFSFHHGYGWECIHTRFRAPVGKTDFRFRLFTQGLFTVVAHLAGMQDVKVGDREFDRAFVVQASDERRIRDLLGDPALRKTLVAEPKAEVTLRDSETAPGTAELALEVPVQVKDLGRLRRVFDAFAGLLGRLMA